MSDLAQITTHFPPDLNSAAWVNEREWTATARAVYAMFHRIKNQWNPRIDVSMMSQPHPTAQFADALREKREREHGASQTKDSATEKWKNTTATTTTGTNTAAASAATNTTTFHHLPHTTTTSSTSPPPPITTYHHLSPPTQTSPPP